jgi:hypothetical protein
LNHDPAVNLNAASVALGMSAFGEKNRKTSIRALPVATQLGHQLPKLGELDQASFDLNVG